ncbi:MAG: hypothetical protein EA001_09630 [Oscillatoriales cyanobacterium]|nr:MAG: hypothetical protein EA001_09630 [Oscillatoriales cyanobacterium]
MVTKRLAQQTLSKEQSEQTGECWLGMLVGTIGWAKDDWANQHPNYGFDDRARVAPVQSWVKSSGPELSKA